jgi:hypothetical protein
VALREDPVSDLRPDDMGQGPAVEVRVYRHGELVHTERCESEDAAAAVVEWWEETLGIECEVDDLSVAHHESASELGDSIHNDTYPHARS